MGSPVSSGSSGVVIRAVVRGALVSSMMDSGSLARGCLIESSRRSRLIPAMCACAHPIQGPLVVLQSARRFDEDPGQQVSRLDHRVVAELQ